MILIILFIVHLSSQSIFLPFISIYLSFFRERVLFQKSPLTNQIYVFWYTYMFINILILFAYPLFPKENENNN